MVASATNLSRSGVRDWLIQRISAVVIAAYTIFLIVYFLLAGPQDYSQWHALFNNPWMQVFSFLALLCLVMHAWVGVWTIFTDYVKPFGLRLFLEVILALALIVYLIWGAQILWGY